MSISLGKTLRLFLVDGSPTGIVVAEIMNWTGQITRFPREMLATFLERAESSRTGVYLLVGDDETEPGRLRIYIGETDNVGNRIRQHANDEQRDWNFACTITSKDQNLTKSHVLYLESRMINAAVYADRATVDNSRQKIYESMPESDLSDMAYFFEQIATVLPTLGVDLFVPPELAINASAEGIEAGSFTPASTIHDQWPAQNSRQPSLEATTGPSSIEVFLRDPAFGVEARGVELNGEILVRAGSTARGHTENQSNGYNALRARLIREGKLRPTDDGRLFQFSSDVLFSSPSAASAVVLDRNDNGRASWREAGTGKTLNQWYREHANIVTQPSAPSGPEDATLSRGAT